jgi:hypothetical protein
MKVYKLRRKKFYQIGHQVEDDVSEDEVGEAPLRADAEEVVLVGGIDLPTMSIFIYNCKWNSAS